MQSAIRRAILGMLVIVWGLLGVCAVSETLEMPEKLTVIEEEAFFGAASIDNVVVPGEIEEIHTRAFAYSGLTEILLPPSVEYIADDAFIGCKNLVVKVNEDSYAHKWAAFSGVKYVVLPVEDAQNRYFMDGVEFKIENESAFALAAVTTGNDACTLQIRLLDEETESCFMSYKTSVDANLFKKTVRVSVDGALPEYFVVEAVLLDDQGRALSNSVRDIKNTHAYHVAQSSKAEDYPADRVLNYGKAGFAVLAEGVTRVSGKATERGGYYSFSQDALGGKAPQVGDILLLNINGVHTPVKVGSVQMGRSGSITVKADTEIYMEDVYDKLSINGNMEADGSAGNVEVGNVVNYDESFTYGDGALKLDVDCGMSIYVVATYDKHNLGRDYFLFDVEADIWGGSTATLEGEYETEEDEIELEIYSGKVIIPVVNLPADLIVTLPVNLSVKGTGSVEVGFKKTIGFSWDSKKGFVKKEEPGENWADANLQISFNADAGPEVTLDISLFDIFGARITGNVGIEATGTLIEKIHVGTEKPTEEEAIHACDSCLGIDVDLFARADAAIYYHITEECSDDLLEKEIFDLTGDLMELYISIINEKESVFGGQLSKGMGTCPNYQYRVNVSTQDMYGKAVEGLSVSITGSNGSSKTLTSPGKVYLYDANYVGKAQFDSGEAEEVFSVRGEPKSVVIQEEELVIQGSVTDKRTGEAIEKACVLLKFPNGKTLTGYTDSNGRYMFDKLPGGRYSLLFSKEDYESKEYGNLDFPAGTYAIVNAELMPGCLPVIMAETWAVNTRVQALTEEGTCPEGVPEVFITVKSDYWIEEIVISHEDCKSDSIITPGWYKTAMKFYGVDMGNGDYTYVLQLADGGTGGGYEIIIFHEFGGKLVRATALESVFTQIRVKASFTDDTHFTGTLEPTGVRISGEMPLPYSGFKRKGESIYAMGGGYLNYEKNEDGAYDLVYSERNAAGGYNWDNIGRIVTRFRMKDGNLTLHSQTFEMYEGGTVTIG